MQFVLARRTRLLGVCGAVALLLPASFAWAAQGAGSLYVAGASGNPTHWDIPIGVPTVAEIRGVLASEVGGTLTPTITVIVKSSHFGNTVLVGTRIGLTSDYSFSYTPPAVAAGDDFDACATTIVAYHENGQNTNNDLIDDGLQNGSSNSAAGFRFVDGAGDPIDCIDVGVDASTWSTVKSRYRD
jgi:hypothetical protein